MTAPKATDSTVGRVLELVRARAASAEAEVFARWGLSGLTRFANSVIHQSVAEEVSHVLLRVALDGHVATVALDGPPDADHLGRLVGNAFEAARAQPLDPGWPGLTQPTRPVVVDHWDDGTAEAKPDDRAKRVGAFVAASGGLETAGFCSSNAWLMNYLNTAGHVVLGRTTSATIDGIARTPTAV